MNRNMSNTYTKQAGISLSGLVIVLFLVAAVFVFRPEITGRAKDVPSKESVKGSVATDAKPASSGTAAGVQELAKQIDATIDESELGYARWGVHVVSLAGGAIIYQRNAEKLFTPASNMKVYTTGVALEVLGPDFRWRTSVYGSAQPDRNGRVAGDLVLYGRGAPDFVSRTNDAERGSLDKLVDALYERGVRHVDGDVFGDASYFRGDPLGEGWQWTDLQWYFAAEASALSINSNEVGVNLVPAEKISEAPAARAGETSDHVNIQNRMVVGKAGTRPTIGVHRGLSDNNVVLWGETVPGSKGFGARLSVHNPALWAAKMFRDALKSRGISIAGEAKSRDSRVAPNQRFDPAHAVELAFVMSQPLSKIARTTNKESNNLYAELILRTMGRERAHLAALPEAPGRERGDDETGVAVMRSWLARAGIAVERLALHDGSGLSRLNLVTPQSTTGLLTGLGKSASSQVFKESLPVAGRDGTLGGRLKMLTDRVSAKTGSLTYDNTLSGYITAANGEVLVFSIMCNDQTRRKDSTGLIDEIVKRLAGYPEPSAAGQ